MSEDTIALALKMFREADTPERVNMYSAICRGDSPFGDSIVDGFMHGVIDGVMVNRLCARACDESPFDEDEARIGAIRASLLEPSLTLFGELCGIHPEHADG